MESQFIRHTPKHIDHTLQRRLEIEPEIRDGPHNQPELNALCPDCASTMVYRGLARLRGGKQVHYFECIHSHREVHSVSIIIAD